MMEYFYTRIAWTETEFHRLFDGWNETVSGSCSDRWFRGSEWLDAWWEIFGAGSDLFVVVVEQQNRVAAIAPLYISQEHPLGMRAKKLQFIGGAASDYADLVVAGKREDSIALVIETLKKYQERWDWGELLHIPRASPNWDILHRSIRTSGFLESTQFWSVCPYVPIEGTFQDFFARLPKKHRDDIKRQEKHLQSVGPISFRVLNRLDPDLSQHFKMFWQMRQARYQHAGRDKGDRFSEYEQFYWNLLEKQNPSHGVHFSALLCGDRPVAYHFGFLANGRLYYYTPTFDPEFASFSPGKVLIKYLLMHAFEQGMTEFDFLLGDEPYKLSWAREFREVYNILFFPRTTRGYVLYFWLGLLRPTLKRWNWIVMSVRLVRTLATTLRGSGE